MFFCRKNHNLIFSKKPYSAVRFISESFKIELQNLLKENQFDIIQLEGLYVCPYIPVIRENSNAKIAYRSHNIEHEIWNRSAVMAKGFVKLYYKILSKRLRKFEIKILNP